MSLFVRTTSDKGAGVFAAQILHAGSEVLRFSGPVLSTADVPFPIQPEDDHYLQIGPETYLGPSGAEDDLVNHSCDPNCLVRIDDWGAVLIALKDIPVDTEITFDYSTTSTDNPKSWVLWCLCGSPQCREMISGFHLLPEPTRLKYIENGMVPLYVVK